MSTNLLPISAVAIRASADATRVSDTHRRRSTAVSGGGKWWTPLFGWSADADYIDNNADGNARKAAEIPAKKTVARFTPRFTEEKAKELRMRTKESFHDVMYHSAIASRLASDFSTRRDGDQ
ncbi:hypothetical protein vseg_000091 [Gypsophila vaccaria]